MNLKSLNPFSYSFAEVAPLLVSLVFVVGYAVTLFVSVPDVNFVPACATLLLAVFGLVEVFLKGAPNPVDFSKALKQLQAAGTAVAIYFVTIPASTTNKISVLIGAIVSAFAIAIVHYKVSQPRLAKNPLHQRAVIRPTH
jgi:hypothetical protein